MTSRIRRTFAFASTILLLSLLFTLPRARSAGEPRLLYLDVDTGGSYPSILVAAKLDAIVDDGFRVGVIGSTTPFPSSIALTFCPPEGEDQSKGVAYTIANTFSPQNQLAKLDPRTGAATLVGSPIAQELDIMTLACAPDGTLYAVGQLNPTNSDGSTNPDFNSLYTVDRETGFATRIGSTGVNDQASPYFNGFFMALAFAPDGTLYGVGDGAKGSTLYSINIKRDNGLATKVADINVDAVMGLAIDKDGKFYVADYAPGSKIYTLDSGTGMTTSILETHLDYVNNIAFN